MLCPLEAPEVDEGALQTKYQRFEDVLAPVIPWQAGAGDAAWIQSTGSQFYDMYIRIKHLVSTALWSMRWNDFTMSPISRRGTSSDRIVLGGILRGSLFTPETDINGRQFMQQSLDSGTVFFDRQFNYTLQCCERLHCGNESNDGLG